MKVKELIPNIRELEATEKKKEIQGQPSEKDILKDTVSTIAIKRAREMSDSALDSEERVKLDNENAPDLEDVQESEIDLGQDDVDDELEREIAEVNIAKEKLNALRGEIK